MTITLHPFQFVKTIIAYGVDEEDAERNLYEIIADQGDDIYDDWACDELFEENEVWKPIILEDK